jgi:branched-chain amino acid transport system permease protein
MKAETIASMIALAALAFAPFVVGGYIISVLTLVLFFAYFGQAWNIMMGFSGQLSLGHGLFVGLGGYTMAVLLLRCGINPWFSLPIAAALCAGAGAIIGYLGFRFAVRGIYFALLTIAFAEFTRVVFDNWSVVGGTAGLFLPVPDPHVNPLINLRGSAGFFYYVMLAMTGLVSALALGLLRSRFGYLWRAIRDDEESARAMGVQVLRLKIGAVALSAALTGAGGAIYALYNGSLFPDTMMGMGLSIQLIVAPIIGGLGTIVGPLIGAVFVILISELAGDIGQATGLAGLNSFVYGIAMILVIVFMPDGIWPALRSAAVRLMPARSRPATVRVQPR